MPKLDAVLYCDYKQIEPRLLAYYLAECGDDTLAKLLCAGEDVYTAIVRQIYRKDEITEEERQTGKRLFLSLQYGGGIPTVIKQWGVDYGEAKRMVDQFHAAWPGIRMLQRQLDRAVEQKGYIRTLMGKHLRPNSPHKRLNVLIQGGAAEIIRMAMVRVHEELQDYESHMVNVVHDELQLDCIWDEIPHIVENIPEWMDYAPVSAVVSIPIDVEWTQTSWANKTIFKMEDYIGSI